MVGSSDVGKTNLTCARYIDLYRGNVRLSRHGSEAEAIAAADVYAWNHGGVYTLRLTYSGSKVRVIGVQNPNPTPAQVVGLAAVDITTSSVTLTWALGDDATSWLVFRDGTQIAAVTSVPYTDSTVAAATEYDYTVKGKIGNSIGPASDVLTLTTDAQAVPDVPTGLVLVTNSFNSVHIAWDTMARAASYDVHRNGGFLANSVQPSYTDSTVTDDTAYTYQVKSVSAAGSSALCSALNVTTLHNQAPIWGAIPDQAGTVGNAVSLDLRPYCDDPEDQPVTFSIVGGSVPGLQISSNGFLIVGTLTTAGNYTLIIRANDGDNTVDTTVDWVVSAAADTTAPTVPTNVSGSANGSTVTVTWTVSTDPVVAGQQTSGIRRYRIHRGGLFISFDDGPPFVQTGVPDGTYSYTVLAEDNAGNISAASAPAVVQVVTPPSAPDVPINFVATGVSATQIDLSWARGPSGAAPTDYDIDFSTTSASGPWTALPVTGTATTFSHTGIASPVQHWYRLRANAGALSSGYTNATGTPSGGNQSADFIVAGTVDEIDCRALRDVGGTVRKVRPGEIIQINARPSGGGPQKVFQIWFPEGQAGNHIRVVPQPNTQVIFRRASPAGNFVFMIHGPTHPSTGVVPVADRTKYGYITIDGFTTSNSVPTSSFDGKRHGFKFLPSVSNPGQDNPTYVIKTNGFISDVKLRYIEIDYRGANPAVGGVTKNDSDFLRSDYPGTFRGGMTIEHCLFMNIGSCYLGQNFGPGYLPSRNTTVAYSMFLDAGQTPILVKNHWEGFSEVHHNIVKHSGSDTGPVIQRNSISMTATVGECHHNWCEDTGSGFLGNSKNNVFALRMDCNDGPYVAPFQGYPGYASFTLKVYSNIIFQCFEGGINFGSSNSQTPDPIAKYKAEVFSNTIDNCLGSGSSGAAVRFNEVFAGSFCRNNIATRTNGYNGIPAADVSRNVSDSNIGRFVNVYAYTNRASYTGASESQKNYKLSTAEPVYGGSLGTDIATTDFAGAYNGTVPDTSPDAANDVTRSGGGYDMGALEKV